MKLKDVKVKSIIYELEADLFLIRFIKKWKPFSFVLCVLANPSFLVTIKNKSQNRFLYKKIKLF